MLLSIFFLIVFCFNLSISISSPKSNNFVFKPSNIFTASNDINQCNSSNSFLDPSTSTTSTSFWNRIFSKKSSSSSLSSVSPSIQLPTVPSNINWNSFENDAKYFLLNYYNLPQDSWQYLGQDNNIKVWRIKEKELNQLVNNIKSNYKQFYTSTSSSISSPLTPSQLEAYTEKFHEYSKWPCVKSFTTLNMNVETLSNLLLNSTYASTLNKFNGGRYDIQLKSDQDNGEKKDNQESKIVWSRTKIPYIKKQYDFLFFMHKITLKNFNKFVKNIEEKSQTSSSSTSNISTTSTLSPLLSPFSSSNSNKFNDETTLILSRSCSPHFFTSSTSSSSSLSSSPFHRSEIILGLNILSPNKENSSCTDLLTLSHVKYKKTSPLLAWRSVYKGSITYMKQFKQAIEGLKDNNK